MIVAPGAWIALIVALAVLLASDLLLAGRRGGEMSLRFAPLASVAWIAIALAFGGLLALLGETAAGADYTAGYLVEKSPSLDNVFVFLLVFGAFGVAEAERHRLLTYGIVGALVMRAVFIVVGAAALERFGWIAFGFAALLVYTGWSMFRHRHDHDSEEALVEKLPARCPIAKGEAVRGQLLAREDGKRVLTVGGAALLGIAVVDLIFALDSVPAILAITPEPFIVFAANAFALLGLRPLFFLVAELVGKIGPEYTQPGIALILGTGVVASLVRERRRERRAVAA